jgi:hypothetical protein
MTGNASWLTRRTAAVVLCAQLLALASPAAEAAPAGAANCTSLVQRAIDSYNEGRFDEGIQFLKVPVAEKSCPEADLLDAREMLARCYVRAGDSNAALEEFKALICQSPTWQPDTDRVQPEEVAVFRRAFSQSPCVSHSPVTPAALKDPAPAKPRQPDSRSFLKRRWKWLAGAGGAILVGSITYTLVQKDVVKAGPLPDPPGPPADP